MAEQRAGGERGLVWWDYHCIGLDHAHRIWDLDSLLALPVAAEDWLARTFQHVDEMPEAMRPYFRLVPAEQYHKLFASDRRHMRAEDGGWLHAPPPWPCIGAGSNLDWHRNITDPDGPGVLYDLAGFSAFINAGADGARGGGSSPAA